MATELLTEISIWVNAFFILAVFSWLYRYNRFFKFAEYTLVGSAAGYALVQGFENIKKISIGGITQGKVHMVIPLLLGLALYTRYIKDISWVSRYGIAFMVAVGSTLAFRTLIVTQITQQIASTIEKVQLTSPLLALNSVIIVGLTVFTMLYFIFSSNKSEKVPGYGVINKIGRYGVLTTLGFYLGITVMTRLAFVINRLEYLLFDWLRMSRF